MFGNFRLGRLARSRIRPPSPSLVNVEDDFCVQNPEIHTGHGSNNGKATSFIQDGPLRVTTSMNILIHGVSLGLFHPEYFTPKSVELWLGAHLVITVPVDRLTLDPSIRSGVTTTFVGVENEEFKVCRLSHRTWVSWRIIPVSKWLITMANKSPKDRIVPLINGRNSWLINGGDAVHYLRPSWDDPPS